MKNTKKICLSIMLILALSFSLFGCSKTDDNQLSKSFSLRRVCNADEIEFDSPHIEISIQSSEDYYFSNQNQDFCEKFAAFLDNTKFNPTPVDPPDCDKFYISIYDGEYASFSVFEADVIGVHGIAASSYYYCEGIYEKFKNTFDTFLNENKKYCRTADTPIRNMIEYVVYDKNQKVLESDSTTETPHLFYNSGIVHLWMQTGTGQLTRWGRFFDVENSLISPVYYGQTDYFGNLVSSTASSTVIIYEMWTGREVYVFDRFEKPLGDCIENILSAHFTNDGTQIIVKYLNTDFELETQVIDLPKN